jgi:hypothetical protein
MSTARERLELARRALVATKYFTEDEVGDDVAPRITELWSTRVEQVLGAASVDQLIGAIKDQCTPGVAVLIVGADDHPVTIPPSSPDTIVVRAGDRLVQLTDREVFAGEHMSVLERRVLAARFRAHAETLDWPDGGCQDPDRDDGHCCGDPR